MDTRNVTFHAPILKYFENMESELQKGQKISNYESSTFYILYFTPYILYIMTKPRFKTSHKASKD